jgi:glutathione synthase/RimK-type ligase-like ATP-grasp enzyme
MRKIKYLFQCLFRIDVARMFRTVHKLAKENGKFAPFVFFDMIWCALRYSAGYVDYLIFDIINMSAKRRRTFVTRGINNEFIRKLNRKEAYYKFEDKTVFNTLFKDYVKRKWARIPAGEAFSGFENNSGVADNTVVIVKPVSAVCGQKVEKTEIHSILPADYERIVEECIIQHDDVAKLHPSSVNTLRFMTIVNSNGANIMLRALRIGTGGSVVDNFNAGGLFVLLNEDGVVISDAINKKTEMFARHPDTDVVFKGYKIPFFKESQELVKRAALFAAEEGVRYVGWDVAVTPDCPVFVEANHNPGYDLLQSKAYLVDNEFGRLPDFREVVDLV